MINKPITNLILFALLPLFSFPQQQEKLREIIASSRPIEVRQQQLDSFFLEETKGISAKVLADCYHDYGARWWYYTRWIRQRDLQFLDQAIAYAEKAARMRKKQDTVDPVALKKSMYNVGFFNYLKADYFEAIDAFLDLVIVGETDAKTMQAYRMLGNAYTEIGDFYKALHSFEKVISFAKKDSLQRKLLINTYIERANTYTSMGYKEFSEQIRTDLISADSILKKAKIKDRYNTSRIRQIEGNRLLTTGNYQKAIPFFKEVSKSLPATDSSNLSVVYNSLALSQLKLQDFEAALESSKKSILYDSYYSSPYENLGDYYIQSKEFEEGLFQYQKAIVYASGLTKDIRYDDVIALGDLEVAVDKDHLLSHLISKANGWVSYYRYDQNENHLLQALKTFTMADQLIDLIRFESTEYKSKLFWREQGAALYMKAVEVCFLLHKPEEAYYFMEKNKALLLLEDITNEQAKAHAHLPDHIAKREFTLKRNIYLSENELQHKAYTSKNTIAALKDTIYNHKRRYEQFVDSLSVAFPNYAAIKKKVVVMPFNTFKKKYTTDQEWVLQYILNNDLGFGLLTSAAQSILFPIDGIDQLHTDIFVLHKEVSQPFSTQEQLTAYQELAHRIFQQLIPKEVYEQVIGKNLTIIPDHILQQLSFETLVTHKDPLRYLIEDTEIRYAYSMSYLDRNLQIRRDPKKRFLGLAPITFDTMGLSALNLSEEEVIAIGNMCKGEILIQEQATKANFLNNVNDYKILHLSTHADIGEATNPWIAFADAKISLNEIYATKNQADMVVLSACKTSLGELKKGEGVMSLARGFFHSGTKSVVSSLWSANDKSNQELLIDFYTYLNQGFTKSAALRKAKLKYVTTHTGTEQSPFYWGALVLIGDNAMVQLSSGFSIWVWVGIFFVLLISVIFLYNRVKRT